MIELDLENTITIKLISTTKHYPDNNEKSRWKKVASKKLIVRRSFTQSHLQEKSYLILSLGSKS